MPDNINLLKKCVRNITLRVWDHSRSNLAFLLNNSVDITHCIGIPLHMSMKMDDLILGAETDRLTRFSIHTQDLDFKFQDRVGLNSPSRKATSTISIIRSALQDHQRCEHRVYTIQSPSIPKEPTNKQTAKN